MAPDTDQPVLDVRLDVPLPEAIGVGAGTALFVCGTCFSARGAVTTLTLVVDGEEQPVMAHGMPRLDLMRALHPGVDPFATAGMAMDPECAEDPWLTSYRSGFWGFARVGPRPPGARLALALRAGLADGTTVTHALGEVPVSAPPAPLRPPALGQHDAPLVAVCMATHEPPPDLFRRQVESIRAQTHGHWLCVISDDASSPRAVAAMRAALAGDQRFLLSRSERRLGFYRNFERALELAPAEAEYIALADQDDEWRPEKLAVLLEALGPAQLAYSDARIVTAAGEVIAETYWAQRRNNHEDMLSLLVANAVTGAASLLRREVLHVALPFPPAQFAHFHDHWLGLCALALGDIRFVDRPLYDYVQHGGATLGHDAANRMPRLRERAEALRRDPRERVRIWRMHYFVDACRLMQFALVLRARCGERMPRAKRRALDAFLRKDRSLLPLATLAARGAREVLGRGRPETLGAEWMLAHAFAWRHLLAATVRDRPVRGLRLDAVPPPALDPKPGAHASHEPQVRLIAEKIAPLRLGVREDAPRRVNLLIPTIDLQHLFGGYIAKFNLARRLAARGLRVRVVTVDPVGPLPRSWRAEVEAYSGLAGLLDEVEIAFGRESQGLEVGRDDAFVATTWWTAHIAHAALEQVTAERFLYLIQEYEPFTFPMGSLAALAAGSYDLPHAALFSTELLREYFRRHAIGVYAMGREDGDRLSEAFENAITAIDPPSAAELAARDTRRLLFYARPEGHAARNMFELGVLALGRAVERGAFGPGWELHGIGTVEGARRLSLGSGTSLRILPRSSQGSYAELLRRYDVGLALMYTPHPSLVPIEMASAGMVGVTSTFENKTPKALAAISSNLVAAPPTIDGVAGALCEAAASVDDVARRAEGSRVRWSRDWDTSFPDALLERLEGLLGVR